VRIEHLLDLSFDELQSSFFISVFVEILQGLGMINTWGRKAGRQEGRRQESRRIVRLT
jgi:hypothetical protein